MDYRLNKPSCPRIAATSCLLVFCLLATALAASGCSVVSAQLAAPAAPGNVKVVASYRAANLSWDQVDTATSYTIHYRVGTSVSSSDTLVQVSNTQAYIPGLDPANEYTFMVSASNGAGEGAGSISVTVLPSAIDPVIKYRYFMYVGDTGSSSIYGYEIDETSGGLKNPQSYTTTVSSTNAIVVDAVRRQLYTACEGSNNFAIFPVKNDGSLGGASAWINMGNAPARLMLHRSGNWLLGAGGIHLFGMEFNGGMTPVTALAWATTPFADTYLSDAVMQGSGDFVYAFYTGSGQIACFAVNPVTGALSYQSRIAEINPDPNPAQPGDKAAHQFLAMHPTLPALYVAGRNNVDCFALNPVTGALTAGPSDYTHGNTDSVVVDPLGKFLFAANQSSVVNDHDPINVYAIDQGSGQIIPNGGIHSYASTNPLTGISDYHIMAIDPTGRFLYDYTADANFFQVFAINRTSGALTELGLVTNFPGTRASIPVIVRIQQ